MMMMINNNSNSSSSTKNSMLSIMKICVIGLCILTMSLFFYDDGILKQSSISSGSTVLVRHEPQQSQNEKQNQNLDSITTTMTTNTQHQQPLPSIVEVEAIHFVMGRRMEYNNQNISSRWYMRGVGYLYHHWNMILLAELVSTTEAVESEQNTTTTTQTTTTNLGRNVIRIRNVLQRGNQQQQKQFYGTDPEHCHLWTWYVRVMGPEIFAGSAQAIISSTTTPTTTSSSSSSSSNNHCHWEFPFHVQIPGTYTVDAKILYYNGSSTVEKQCTFENTPLNISNVVSSLSSVSITNSITSDRLDQRMMYHRGFKGFKMYYIEEMCCEICSRMYPHCLYWSSPPIGLVEPTYMNNGCELFFTNITSLDEWIPSSMFVNNTLADNENNDHSDSNKNHHYDNDDMNNNQNQEKQKKHRRQRLLRELNQQYGTKNVFNLEELESSVVLLFNNDFTQNPENDNIINKNYYVESVDEDVLQQQQQNHRNRNRRQQRRRLDVSHGPVLERRPVHFAGCGWSFWMGLDYPCFNGELDDKIYIPLSSQTFTVVDNEHIPKQMIKRYSEVADNNNNVDNIQNDGSTVDVTEYLNRLDSTDLPFCTIDSELEENHKGRWVRRPYPNTTMCPLPLTQDEKYSAGFHVSIYDPIHPQCYYRDDLSIIGLGCIEMNCRFIPETSKWITALHTEQQWYGKWEPYDCRYIEYTDHELQQCITERRIGNITGSGHSIWTYLHYYLDQRLQNIVFYEKRNSNTSTEEDIISNSTDSSNDEARIIHLSTLSLLHNKMKDLRNVLDAMPVVDNDILESYWVNSLYISSEREHEARGPVQVMKTKVSLEILQPKGYKMLNLYDMTAAFTYDTATQFDGVHIIGPPMKMLMTKLFHHICYDSRIGQTKRRKE